MLQIMIRNRRWIQIGFTVLTVYALVYLKMSLLVLLAIGAVSGVIFGKVYCKWMCPMGLMMESMTSSMGTSAANQHMYNYYKMGCPISWMQSITNKMSLFKIKVNTKTCTSCGICDNQCYITSINPEYSFYKTETKQPGVASNCSKCFKCVDSCPTKSIHFTL